MARTYRKSRPKKRQDPVGIDDTTGHTQNRLRHLETVIEQLNERVKAAEHHGARLQSQLQQQEATPIDSTSLSALATSDHGDTDFVNDSPVLMSLPPLEDVLPIVKVFLHTFNTALPLFHANSLLYLIHHFYKVRLPQRDPVVWAAINVVLALAYRSDLVGSRNTNLSVEYLNKADSVLSAVVLGDTHLLNIQVLVGMVFLLQASPDLTHSLVLIATTIRLAHKIGLHDRTASACLDAVDARQRACVFWMAYILDKDLSMRSKQPSIQLDDDVDLDLPSPGIAEYQIKKVGVADIGIDPGVFTTADGNVEMNYFVTRIQLAVIEGGVYDYLYSTRSRNRSAEERSQALKSIFRALETWKASIPLEFDAPMAPKTISPTMLQFLAVLHSTSLACTTLLNQANVWNTLWMSSIWKYATEGITPVLPFQWEATVDQARHLAVLIGALPVQNRWNFW
ncbi:uncharacterized protein N0V89_000778 [Didymosphaeria variabile]|uniref:Xylanolytic transcriptional activator regulatory domain-containing protein n=1 Tax=Didymosphaeria variabile TaxID=1932322 RepID=A0A9W8XVU9_9PLEO|nr:uncharacterized protein N0V89_000778 [Didymosphaeria variabile]KAJ4360218.1 hypothetical protein N0V89_000778 [Didymosphaeria variabile]